jgi:1-acyl-sn-glycerol-3-phosphate acyltransferase
MFMEDWKLEPAHDLGLPLKERARSLRRESGLIESGLHLFWWLALRAYFRAWHRLEIRGRENLPARPPFACIANHSSHLDALALACALPGRWRDCIFPIAAGDTFFNIPAVAAFAAFILNALPMWRRNCGSHSLQELRERLIVGPSIYLLFPEGTRSRDGRLGPFKPGLGMLVAETAVPVVPCFLEGTFRAFPPRQKFPRPNKIILHIGKPLAFAATKNDRAGWMEIAATTQRSVEELETKTIQPRH